MNLEARFSSTIPSEAAKKARTFRASQEPEAVVRPPQKSIRTGVETRFNASDPENTAKQRQKIMQSLTQHNEQSRPSRVGTAQVACRRPPSLIYVLTGLLAGLPPQPYAVLQTSSESRGKTSAG